MDLRGRLRRIWKSIRDGARRRAAALLEPYAMRWGFVATAFVAGLGLAMIMTGSFWGPLAGGVISMAATAGGIWVLGRLVDL